MFKVGHGILSHLITFIFGWISLGYIAGQHGADIPYIDYLVDFAVDISGEQALIPAILSIFFAISSIVNLTGNGGKFKIKKDKLVKFLTSLIDLLKNNRNGEHE
jgi:hypothetical protein